MKKERVGGGMNVQMCNVQCRMEDRQEVDLCTLLTQKVPRDRAIDFWRFTTFLNLSTFFFLSSATFTILFGPYQDSSCLTNNTWAHYHTYNHVHSLSPLQ